LSNVNADTQKHYFLVPEDVSIQEEAVSDNELPHKTSQMTITSPTSPTSPTPATVTKNDNISPQRPESMAAAVEQVAGTVEQVAGTVEQVAGTVEQVAGTTPSQSPEPNVLPKEQIDSMVQTVLNDQCGLLSEADKNTIIGFLGMCLLTFISKR
jgi:hypothetical protein